MNNKFDELLSEIGNVFFKKESLPKPCLHKSLKELSFKYIQATPRKRNNATQ